MRRDPPTEDDVRNAIERATVSAKRVEIVLSESIVAEGQDRVFISVTQAFNTTTSMGRLTLNMLLSFAQFEREITGEQIWDKVAASKRKGIWMGGAVPLGYRVENRALHCQRRSRVAGRNSSGRSTYSP